MTLFYITTSMSITNVPQNQNTFKIQVKKTIQTGHSLLKTDGCTVTTKRAPDPSQLGEKARTVDCFYKVLKTAGVEVLKHEPSLWG